MMTEVRLITAYMVFQTENNWLLSVTKVIINQLRMLYIIINEYDQRSIINEYDH